MAPRKLPPIVSGTVFGKLTVIRQVESDRWGSIRYECRCDCGNTTHVNASSLRSGNTKSCGCQHKGRFAKETTAIMNQATLNGRQNPSKTETDDPSLTSRSTTSSKESSTHRQSNAMISHDRIRPRLQYRK